MAGDRLVSGPGGAASIARETHEMREKRAFFLSADSLSRFLACFAGDLVFIACETQSLLERADPDLTQFGLNAFLLLGI